MDIPPPRAPLPQRGPPTPLTELVGGAPAQAPRTALPAAPIPAPVPAPSSAVPDASLAAGPEPCDTFERWIREDAAGELDRAHLAELRSHLARCTSCLESRRRAIETLAQVGRGLRANRGAAAPTARLRAQGPLARRRSLLLFLTACAGLFLASRSGVLEGADPRLWATAVGQPARVGEESLDVGGERRLLVRGDVLVVEPGGALQLDSGRLAARLGAGRMLVESSLGPRLRLVLGELALEGRGRVVTPDGVLDLESGALVLESDGGGTRVVVSTARGTWTGVQGARALQPEADFVARWQEPIAPTPP
ncbi:MAG: hypothetical protein GC161_15890 [Planctomycetaceae bacterium]|nr:hypothetical protein [Planctomycetaceae bacterium]